MKRLGGLSLHPDYIKAIRERRTIFIKPKILVIIEVDGMDSKHTLSKKIVSSVLNELNGRSGFDDWWYGIDLEIQKEIITTLEGLVFDDIVTKLGLPDPAPQPQEE